MTTTVIAMYDDPSKAQQVINDIIHTGFNQSDIDFLRKDGDARALAGRLSGHGIPGREADLYAEAIQRGAALIAVDAPDDKAEDALAIMERHGARNLDQMVAELKAELRQQDQSDQRSQSTQSTESLPVIEEEVSIGKQRVLRGGKRLTTEVTERPVEQTVNLKQERVDIEQKPASGRVLSPEEANRAFQERSVEMQESAEEVQIHKQAREVGRVELTKTTEEQQQTVGTTARKSDVRVEDIGPGQGKPAQQSKPGQKPQKH